MTERPTELRDCGQIDILLWLLRQRRRFRVAGESMLPLLQPGDEVLVNPRAYRRLPPQPGDLVVAPHPHRANFWLVKRVVAVKDNQDCILMGDNAKASTDSRTFGAIPAHKLLGKVVCRFL